MKGYKFEEIMKPGFSLPSDREGLEYVYRTLAKTADQRMVTLEKLAQEGGVYASATQWAYKRAAKDIKHWTGVTEKPRWNKKPPRTIGGLESKIEDIKTFLSSLTSRKSGIESYIKRTTSINEKFGTDFSWEDIGNYFESEFNSEIEKKFGSDTKLKAVGYIRKNKDTILKNLRSRKKTKIVVPDPMIEATIDNILKDYKKDVRKYLKSL